jgi:putative acetyltransferase
MEDVERIAAGMKAVVDEGRWLATESTTSVEELEERFRQAIGSGGADTFVFVAEEEGEVVGALGLHPTPAQGVLTLGMWLLPRSRRRGGGRALMEAALDARPPHVHKIELEVFPDNEAAIALYRSLGFDQEGLRRNHFRRLDGSLRSSLIMARLFETEEA